MTKLRIGQVPPALNREQFASQFALSYIDPAFDKARDALAKIEVIAWHNYVDGNKAPITQKAGAEFFNHKYDISVEWLETRNRLVAAEVKQKNPKTKIPCAANLPLGRQ